MFADKSRYAKVEIMTTKTWEGREVTAIKLRKLPVVGGSSYSVKQTDRLDILAYQNYNQPQKFWHIADANSELDAVQLVAIPNKTIGIPKK